MPPLHTRADVAGALPAIPLKVLPPEEAAGDRYPRSAVLLLLSEETVRSGPPLAGLGAEGWAGALFPGALAAGWSLPAVAGLADPAVVGAGDVIRVAPSGLVRVLYRRRTDTNGLMVTERCNNLCLMCSQPPRDDGAAGSAEALAVIPLIDPDCPDLGLTGGEPTLVGEVLVAIIAACRRQCPAVRLHVLTNGRRLNDGAFTARLAAAGGRAVTWAVPLYADVAARHDGIVQAEGAFRETLDGLLNLASLGQTVELRIVLTAQTAPRLARLAEFIWRGLPFVHHVAIMGLEPIGLARRNQHVWIDPADCSSVLEAAVTHLDTRGMAVSLYNFPLCVLAPGLRRFARRSISGWKTVYLEGCSGCRAREACGGFFHSAGLEWRSRAVAPIHEENWNEALG